MSVSLSPPPQQGAGRGRERAGSRRGRGKKGAVGEMSAPSARGSD